MNKTELSIINILNSEVYTDRVKRRILIGTIKELHKKLQSNETIKAFKITVIRPELKLKAIREKIEHKQKMIERKNKEVSKIEDTIIKLKNSYEKLEIMEDPAFEESVESNHYNDIIEHSEVKLAINLANDLKDEKSLEEFLNRVIEENRKLELVKSRIEVIKTEIVPYIKKYKNVDQFVKLAIENDSLKISAKFKGIELDDQTEKYLRCMIDSMRRELARRDELEAYRYRLWERDKENLTSEKNNEIIALKARLLESESTIIASKLLLKKFIQGIEREYPAINYRRWIM